MPIYCGNTFLEWRPVVNRNIFFLPMVLLFGFTAAAEASLIYVESAGQVTGEGELFSRRTSSPDGLGWIVKPTENSGTTATDGGALFSNYRGDGYVQALPNRDTTGGQGPTNAPSIEYDLLINEADVAKVVQVFLGEVEGAHAQVGNVTEGFPLPSPRHDEDPDAIGGSP